MSQPVKNNQPQQDANAKQPQGSPEKADAPKAPKLAPAPVPQDTPWKSFSIESKPVKGTIEQEVASKPSKEDLGKDSKRATNGKEKWVVLDPAITIPAHTPQQYQKPKPKKKQAGRKNGNQKKGGRKSAGSGNNTSNNSVGSAVSDKSKPSKDTKDTKESHESTGGVETESKETKDFEDKPSSLGRSSNTNNNQTIDPKKFNKQQQQQSYSGAPNNGFDPRRFNKPYKSRPRPANTYYNPMNGYIPYQYAPVPSPENILALVLGQVSYYFSIDNLCKDMFLRANMNDEGLVPISFIASFNRVKSITQDINIVAEACKVCPQTEVQNDKVRVKSGYEKWVLPKESRQPNGLDN